MEIILTVESQLQYFHRIHNNSITYLTAAEHSILQVGPGDTEIFLSKFGIFSDALLKALQKELWNIARVNSTYVYL